MNPVIYQLKGVLPTDKYIPGQYRWTVPMQITAVLLDGRPPTQGTLAIILELGGVLKSFRFTVAAGTQPLAIPQNLNLLVPANTLVRWRASFTGQPQDAAYDLSITMQVVEQSVSQVTAVAPRLTVQWANGLERLALFNYDAGTHTFTETAPGISAGRASIVRAGDTQLSIFVGATEVLRVAGQQLLAPAFFGMGGVASTRAPRLLFQVDAVPIATLSAEGLRAVDFDEDDPLVLSPTDAGFDRRFEFYSAGILTAVLDNTGLTGMDLGEAL